MYRTRRVRASEALRGLIRETHLSADQLVMPLFVRAGKKVRAAIPTMPGQFQFSVDTLAQECRQLKELGVPAVLLFGLSDKKDARGSRAYAKNGIVQQAVAAIKSSVPELLVITDVCLCAYTLHGHCGVVGSDTRHKTHFYIDNDASVEILAKVALSHAKAGADLVAPSDMMDGTVGAIRKLLDAEDFDRVPIMAYSVKYASSFYGPFREAVDSAPQFGDRRSYQMDPANAEEALRKARSDVEQGADILMVKPALVYLDIIRRVKQALPYPLAAFNVSGEYAMVKAASARGWLQERPVWMEMLLAMKRAGADILITYWAKDAARLLREE
ncbi:MAG: porphobilinogen synthase [Candidatus Omnitrophica bacterium]|nr:porphobilinogen synthase [Candidatus Omnitrophota bacterium]